MNKVLTACVATAITALVAGCSQGGTTRDVVATDELLEPANDVALDTTMHDPDEDVVDDDLGPSDTFADADALVITDLEVELNPNSTISFFVRWQTNRPASSWVDHGEGPAHGSRRGSEALVTDHRVLVVGCPELRDIHYQVSSTDEWGISAQSEDRVHTTGALPALIPYISLDVTATAESQPGLTLMNISQPKNTSPTVVVYLDHRGRVIWYWLALEEDRFGAVTTEQVQSGDVLVGGTGERPWVQVNLAGDEVYRGMQNPPGEGRLHHHTSRLDDGSTVELRAWWQTYPSDPGSVFTYDEIRRVDTATSATAWSWKAIDHLSWPTGGVSDWTHANAVTVDIDAGYAYLNCRNLEALVKIRIDTGDVVWKMGPCDDCDFTLLGGDWFYKPHDPEILPGGRILLYDNGNGRPSGNRSRAVEYSYDEISMTVTQQWEYSGPPGWYTPIWGDADRLDNGNTLVAAGARDEGNPSKVFEVTSAGDVVWAISMPDTYGVYQAERYPDLGY